MRADQLLVERGLAASRSQSQRLIASGVRWRVSGGDWKTVTKNGDELRETVELQLLDGAESRFVSRGGLKLDGAISRVALSVAGMRCLDVGQSSGGFTDCLLHRGAAQVVGVDVGQGQLHPRLRADARVVGIEQCNARDLDAEAVAAAGGGEAPFDLIVGDLSFISQTLVWPAIVPLLKPGGHLLMLVKPQFELQPAQIGKGGLVKDPASYAVVRERIEQACREHALALLDYFESPITGGDGNREFFVSARAAA
ncbi:MAG: TlyA family RNA methyltransferase [Hydrogenophaga sp.]|jgi:23S rRNA (cytidine1920-2'-O)/16S rRNA (cytidine1409-2'-O)-methyltransferase|uniref:TlyA family RNA methyltransferase n=1 Tax=Hydrogenophaga sp. TaxID=1904254 RepID=UPI0027229A33|nr:TlyA family RNA methyltransferase [Hydrogenophaga sp.]MDO9479851.1 TlyA family RNA methyltransferase [Hydrogenophaga sp.]MDO9571350.1 TlyA family RNA methyltransferase [Hydrogenophaga sp.]MDP2095682.1 TlyA family RNA methyltransferase [Hydrogenophaga sp.]MDP3342990.1 TlyA family RNA methyltransferase [Hydrogenophaga sp.]MDP3808236.1 TlyA family RNA methyltransferase [Hydrogenophaga sp.]